MHGFTDVCNQCGFSHPPLKEGEVCPMAKVKTNDGSDIDFTTFFTMLKSILISQISKKNINNPKRILSFTLVAITKLLEKYEEK